MATITTAGTMFSPELVKDIFTKVKGHSTLAKISGQSPMPFAGTETFIFTMDTEASIVGEGANKPTSDAEFSSITIKPLKFVYQHRLTDEFMKMSAEKQLPYMEVFSDGFAKKMARALDIAAFHGLNPGDGTASDLIGTNHFDAQITQTITFDSTAPDDNIDAAAQKIQTADGEMNAIAMAPLFGSALGAMKTGSEHVAMYPEFRFGGNPQSFAGLRSDINNTVSYGSSEDRAIIGDFANAFKWGYAENIPMEIIQFGDPDGQGDLKRTNQIVLRAEAFIGWGILDPTSFVRIVEASTANKVKKA